ncbi:MAG: hypothetical protein IH988_02100 [Planctomycetes bacterium]|nr:hypothetical protein [Planctomycetota bacterium]
MPTTEYTVPTPAETPQVVPATVSSWRVLVAPWYGIVNPVAAARCLSRGSRQAFVVACVIMLIVGASLIVLIAMWDASGTNRWVRGVPAGPNPTTVSPTGQTAAVPPFSLERTEVPVGQVWADWHQYGWFGQAEYTLLATLFAGMFSIVALAWLFLPYIHRTGPIGFSFGRSLRIAVAVVGLPALTAAFLWSVAILNESTRLPWEPNPWQATRLLPLMSVFFTIVIAIGVSRNAASRLTRALPVTLAVIGALVVSPVVTYLAYLYYLRPASLSTDSVLTAIGILSYACSVVLILYCIGHVFRSVRPKQFNDPNLPPTCEGCGYDLTHQPDDQRCPECGRSTRDSLDPNARRSDSTWERAGGIQGWIREFLGVLFRPAQFYSAMRVRTGDEAAVRFGRWNHVLLGVGGGCWVLFIIVTLLPELLGPSADEFFLIVTVAGLVTILVCWVGHRLGAALVVSVWMVRRSLPDFRWACKVIEYESAFLWAFCVFWGVLLATVALEERWGTNVLGKMVAVGPMPLPIGVVIFVGGTVALSVGWFWRYQIALRAIRWNNF